MCERALGGVTGSLPLHGSRCPLRRQPGQAHDHALRPARLPAPVAQVLQDHGAPAPAAEVAGWLAGCAAQAQQQLLEGPLH